MRITLTTTSVVLVCLVINTLPLESRADEIEAGEVPQIEYQIESGELFVVQGEEKTSVELPAPALSVLVHGTELYVALGAEGAALFDISNPVAPVLVRQVETDREQVTGFIVVQGEVWMRIVSESAVPVKSAGSVHPGSGKIAATAPMETAAQSTGEEYPGEEPLSLNMERPVAIIDVRPGEVKLDVGTKDGVKVGDRFSVFRKIQLEDDVEGEGMFEGREMAGVIEVTAVNEENSLAEVWRGDRVSKEDEVQPAGKGHDTSLMFPRRLDHIAEVSAVLRPILDVSTGGVGGLFDLSGTYIGSFWFANVSVQPGGFGFTERGSLFSTIAVGEAGYDGRAVGLGIGAGAAVYYAKARAGWKEDAPANSPDNQGWSADYTGFVLSQVIRLGTRDGLNFTGRNTLIDFEWGGAHGTIDIPLTSRTGLFLEGGGSAIGYGMGALGVSTWLRGNGDAGSIGLSVSAGFAALWVDRDEDNEDQEHDSVTAIGPMVSIGFDYRFGF